MGKEATQRCLETRRVSQFTYLSARGMGTQSNRAASPTPTNETRTGDDRPLLRLHDDDHLRLLLDDDHPRLPLDGTSERANETVDVPPPRDEMVTETVILEGSRRPSR